MDSGRLTPVLPAVKWNAAYVADFGDNRFCVTRIPGGIWAVKIRPLGNGWVLFIIPIAPYPGTPIPLATATSRDAAREAGTGWWGQATTTALRSFPYAGTGNALNETPQPAGAVEAAFAAWKDSAR